MYSKLSKIPLAYIGNFFLQIDHSSLDEAMVAQLVVCMDTVQCT